MWKKVVARLGVSCLILAFAGVCVDAGSALAAPPKGGGCGPKYCLDVWDPVQCSNGVIYSNSCYAARACATGCHPVWE